MKKAIEVEAYGNLITAWLKMLNIFFGWKQFVLDTLNELLNENILDNQVIWEYLKYNIRKFTIKFSKELTKFSKTQTK